MTTLITGASGYIGSAVVRELLSMGHDVRCLVRETSRMQNFDGLRLELSCGDIGDLHAAQGGRPANFLEVGGMAYKRATPALALVLENPEVKSLLVNLCGAYARTDVIAEGLIAGWKELQPDVSISFCIHGTGEERAQQLVRDQLGVDPHETMAGAVNEAIARAANS